MTVLLIGLTMGNGTIEKMRAGSVQERPASPSWRPETGSAGGISFQTREFVASGLTGPDFFLTRFDRPENAGHSCGDVWNQRTGSLCLHLLSHTPPSPFLLASNHVGAKRKAPVARLTGPGPDLARACEPLRNRTVTMDHSPTRTTRPARRSPSGRVGSTREKDKPMMVELKRISTALGLLAALSTSALAQGSAPNANQLTADAVAGTLRASRNLAGHRIEIQARDGVVTLTGELGSPAQKAEALARAQYVAGVHRRG